MNRRSALKISSLVLPAAIHMGCSEPKDKTTQFIEDYFQKINSAGTAPVEIAQVYLAENPGADTADAVYAFSEQYVPGNVDSASMLSALMDNKIRQDYIDENVLNIKGWYLSETEIRICALAMQYAEQSSSGWASLF